MLAYIFCKRVTHVGLRLRKTTPPHFCSVNDVNYSQYILSMNQDPEMHAAYERVQTQA